MLSVKIRQFQYIHDKSLTFRKDEFTRIYGPSGCGKSTICRAIIWALYGEGTDLIPRELQNTRPNDVPCVELVYQEPATENSSARYMAIRRSKNSDQLLVWTDPQCAPIQGINAQYTIDNFWGPINYSCGIYLEQSAACEFLNMSDKAKIDFLLHLQYRNSRAGNLRAAIEDTQRQLKEKIKTQNSIYQHDLQRFNQLASVDTQNCAPTEQIASWQEECAQLNASIPNWQKSLAEWGARQSQQKIRSELEKNIQQLTTQLCSAEEWSQLRASYQQIPRVNIEQAPESSLSISELENHLQNLERWRILATAAGIVNEPALNWPQRLAELAERRERIIAARAELATVHARIKPYARVKDYYRAASAARELRQEYERLSKLPDLPALETARESALKTQTKLTQDLQILHCPQCTQALRYRNQQLVIAEDIDEEKLRKDLQRISEWLEKARQQEKNIRRKTELERRFAHETEQKWLPINEIEQLLATEDKLLALAHEPYQQWNWPVNYATDCLQYNAAQLHTQIRESRDYALVTDFVRKHGPINEIETKYAHQIELHTQLELLQSQLNDLPTNTSQEIDSVNLETQLNQATARVQELWQLIQKAERANLYYNQHQQIEKLRQELRALEEQEKVWACIYEKFIQLSNSRLEQIVQQFNQNLNYFLERCFGQRQIKAEISLTKTLRSKAVRYKVNLQINLDGNECPRITCLSPGERSRLNLALTLTFAHLVPSPILIMDEILSSLDPERQLTILQELRNYIPSGKICIITDHHAPAGLFDVDYDAS